MEGSDTASGNGVTATGALTDGAEASWPGRAAPLL